MNYIDIGLSFLEGLALILSPCILPILPLILGGSMDQKKLKPYGIITGFILSFTSFAFLSRKLILLFNIDPEIIKYASLILLVLFGFTLLSEKLSTIFASITQKFATIGAQSITTSSNGFMNGVFIGALIGLVWTPCAGPILATVLVQIIRQESDYSALLILASFSLGAGVPMLIITLTGIKLMIKLSFLTNHSGIIRKAFGILIILSAVYIGFGNQILAATNSVTTSITDHHMSLENGLSHPYKAPELKGLTSWLNSNPLTLEQLKGKVVLIDFWTYSCINCVRTLPYLTKWDQKYRDQGLVILGVHAPEFEFEKKKENVIKATETYNIQYPVALDNNFDTWTVYKNKFWPAHYLIDRNGNVVYTHLGEGNYDITEKNIQFLLGADNTDIKKSSEKTITDGQSPETYLGADRSEREIKTGSEILLHHWSINNGWSRNPEYIESKEVGAELIFHAFAKKVFLVMDKKGKTPMTVKIQIKSKDSDQFNDFKTIIVDQATLYELADFKTPKNAYIKIISPQSGLKAFAFTFG